jgi:hypothetical protein
MCRRGEWWLTTSASLRSSSTRRRHTPGCLRPRSSRQPAEPALRTPGSWARHPLLHALWPRPRRRRPGQSLRSRWPGRGPDCSWHAGWQPRPTKHRVDTRNLPLASKPVKGRANLSPVEAGRVSGMDHPGVVLLRPVLLVKKIPGMIERALGEFLVQLAQAARHAVRHLVFSSLLVGPCRDLAIHNRVPHGRHASQ